MRDNGEGEEHPASIKASAMTAEAGRQKREAERR